MSRSLARLRQRASDAYGAVAGRLDQTRAGRFTLETLRSALIVLHHLRSEPVLERAGALSYATVLALVPLLAVSLSIASAVGHDFLREQVQSFAFGFLAPGIRTSSLDVLETFIDRATTGGVVSISGVALFFTSVMLLRNIEGALNRIWGGEEKRAWPVRIAVYVAVMLFGPVLLGVSLAVTTGLEQAIAQRGLEAGPLVRVGTFVAAVAGLTILYKLGPAAYVKKRAAFSGALVAGLLFEAVKRGYAFYTAHFVRYSMIYGSLAAIPLFLIWVYLSWVTVLFGARLAYAVQNAGSWGFAALPRTEGMRARLAARTMLAAAVAQASSRPAPSIHSIAHGSGVNEAAVAESVRLLASAGLLRQDDRGGLIPARPLENISLAEVARAARQVGAEDPTVLGQDPASRAISAIFLDAEHAGDTSLARLDLRALAEPLLGEGELAEAALDP